MCTVLFNEKMSVSKRKQNVVTVEEKLNTIKNVDKGESVEKICHELNLETSTINDWCRSRKTLMDFCTQIEPERFYLNNLLTRCYLHKSLKEMVDDALWL